MYTVELAWFCFDLPDHAAFEAVTASPNPLFPDSRVTTLWKAELERFVVEIGLSATRSLSDLSQAAYGQSEPGLAAKPFSVSGMPGLRFGAYDRARTQIDWWVTLNGLTLSFTLTAKGYPKTLPIPEEVEEIEAVIASVRRVSDGC